jgi:hypothetical protein
MYNYGRKAEVQGIRWKKILEEKQFGVDGNMN